MSNITDLLSWIFFGDFGLLTVTPRYLFCVLFPIMVFLGVLGQVLSRIPFLTRSHPLINQFFYTLLGLGCTTAAITALDAVEKPSMGRRMIWILVLLVPCSSQIALIATFACLVTLRVFAAYLLFAALFTAAIYFFISRVYPLNDSLIRCSQETSSFSLPAVIREAFLSVTGTLIPFSVGSVLISLAMYFGLLDWISAASGPFLDRVLHLPPEAAGLMVLGVLKRDFSSASLLSMAGSGAFDAIQLVVLLVMLTFSVPCFNSTVLLFKQQKLPMAVFIWLGSLSLSLFLGWIVSRVLLICFV